MKLPKGLDEELEMLDDLAPELEAQQKEQQRLQELLGKSSNSSGRSAASGSSRPAPGTIEAAAAELRQQRETESGTPSSSSSGTMLKSTKAAKAPWGTALARGSIKKGDDARQGSADNATEAAITTQAPAPAYTGIGPMPPPTKQKALKKSKAGHSDQRAVLSSSTARRPSGNKQAAGDVESDENGIQLYSQEEFERMFPNRGGQ
jgi:hypothetical protein